MNRLTLNEIKNKLNNHQEWEYENEFLKRDFVFSSFKKSIAFLNQVADIAEIKNHHPILINNFKSIRIQLFTHDVNGISQKDFDLAYAIDKLNLEGSN